MDEIQKALEEKYGFQMKIKEIAAVLRISPGGLRNKYYSGKLLIPLFKDKEQGYLTALTSDVAVYLSARREKAKKAMEMLKKEFDI